jgi:hypothetical protein
LLFQHRSANTTILTIPRPASLTTPTIRRPDKNTNEVAAAMSSNTAAKASAAARAKKKTTAGSKTTGETAADYTTAPPANKPTKLYHLDSGDKYSVCYNLKGTIEYVILTFNLNGMLPPKGGYQCTLAEDGHTISHQVEPSR